MAVVAECHCGSDLWTFRSTEVATRRKELLYIDSAVMREVKSRKKHLAMTWIDYKKA